jgi:hypothetical protein
MGQAHSFDDAEYAIVKPPGGVPMLDWPSDLFSDDASLTDLATVDFMLQCDAEFMTHSDQSEELHILLAA